MSNASPSVAPDADSDEQSQAAATAQLAVQEPIPCPAPSDMLSAHIFGLLGLPIKHDRKPVHNAVKRVWIHWEFRTDKRSWLEIPQVNRDELEAQLRKELETAFPDNEAVAEKIRRCNLWFPKWLLRERHRLRKIKE